MSERTVRGAVERRKEQRDQQEPDEHAKLVLRGDQTFWTPRQIAALRQLGIKNATNADLAIYLHVCQRTGLDPFLRQIHLIERRSREQGEWVYRQVIQVGIDGFRVLAQRAAKNQGVELDYEQTIWFGADGGEHRAWLQVEHPAAAEVTVVKNLPDGRRLRYPGLARFSSYAAQNRSTGELQGQWGVMDDHMIEKCAEAFALRRAFPADLGGMYTPEELQQEPAEIPRLPARGREVQPDDDWVVPGKVETDDAVHDARATREHMERWRDEENHHPGEAEEESSEPGDGTGSPESPESSETGQQTSSPKTRTMNRIHAIFRDHGLGGKDQAELRRLVVTGLLSDQPTEVVRLSAMTGEALDATAQALDEFCKLRASRHGGDANLIGYADEIRQQIEVRQREHRA